MNRRRLRLGTRRSTLAWAQSLWVAERLSALDTTTEVELVPIETRGDRITDVALKDVEGKEFFTAELDAALLASRVDLTVHSLKDLSLERPEGIALAAIPRRENPRDVIVFAPDARERLARGEPLRLGSSAPRRAENVPAFLRTALPGGRSADLRMVDIRGNVDTRLGRLREPADNERRVDGVVLALAGLIRLWNDTRPDGGRERLEKLLDGVHWMVLPLTECPTAPGQGALAVECREDDAATLTLVRQLNDEISGRQVDEERDVLAHYGGGCHQRFGATCISHEFCGNVLYVRGSGAHGEKLDYVRWVSLPASPGGRVHAWDGMRVRENAFTDDTVRMEMDTALFMSEAAVFIAHSRALPAGSEERVAGRRVWTAGTASWRRLAARGVWVEGCAEGLGFDWICPTLEEAVLGLPGLDDWQILTHAAAIETWTRGQVIGTYALPEHEATVIEDADRVTHVFWATGSQYRQFADQLPRGVHHACGPGKTAELIRAAGAQPFTVFPSVQEWRRWLGLTQSSGTDSPSAD
jgi:hydroxymethylbilane synthase